MARTVLLAGIERGELCDEEVGIVPVCMVDILYNDLYVDVR